MHYLLEIFYYPSRFWSGIKSTLAIRMSDRIITSFFARDVVGMGTIHWINDINIVLSGELDEYETISNGMFKVTIHPGTTHLIELETGDQVIETTIDTHEFLRLLTEYQKHLDEFIECDKQGKKWHGLDTRYTDAEIAEHKDEWDWSRPIAYYDPRTHKTGLWKDVEKDWVSKK